jgi:uncharacterized protein (DUF58 family)
VLAGLEIELLLPEHVSARVTTAARVRIRNLKRITPSFSIELAGARDPIANTPSILKAPVYFPLVPGRGMIEAAVTVVFPHRGRHRENIFVLSTRFPFGFLRKTTTVSLRRETVVYPSLEENPEMERLLDSVSGEIDSQFRGTGRDFYRIRPYETNDSARHVDWKSTAHAGTLQVREFTRDEKRAVEIYFDRRVSPGSEADTHARFERAVERCAYLAWRIAEPGTRLRFRSQRFSLALPEEGDVYDMLRFLSLVEPIVVFAGNQEAEPPLDDSNLQIVFSAQPGDFRNAGWPDARIVGPDTTGESDR